MPTQTEGLITLGLLAEYVPATLALRLLPEFRKEHPRVRFALRFCQAPRIEEELIADRISFGITTEMQHEDFLQSVSAGLMEYVAVAAKSYVETRGPLDRIETVLLSDILDLGAHMPLTRHWVGERVTAVAPILAQLQPAFVLPNFHAALEVMAAGAGVAFLPKSLVADGLASGAFVALARSHQPPSRSLLLVYRKRSARLLTESLFMEFLLERLPLTDCATGRD